MPNSLSFQMRSTSLIHFKRNIFLGKISRISSAAVLTEMGNGERSLKNFHFHIPDRWRKRSIRGVPEGCLPIKVGREGEEQKRFLVPVMYFNHPLFLLLLKASEEEYGFDQKGTFSIPHHVEEFRLIKNVIDREINFFQRHHSCRHFSCFPRFDQQDSAFN